ncbi:hypothetical protein ABKV19_023010 [Rosa sericea]
MGLTAVDRESLYQWRNWNWILQVNYLSFHPCNEWILPIASSDTTVVLFDMQKLTVPLHALSGHTIGDEQLEGDGDDGLPELLFSHGDLKAKISYFSRKKESTCSEGIRFELFSFTFPLYKI